MRSTSVYISIFDFTIFVEIFKAWKKVISDGSNPVGPFGILISHGAT